MTPRGTGGSVAGASRATVDKKLVQLIERLRSESGLTFDKVEARFAAKALLPRSKPTFRWLLVNTLTELPGVRDNGDQTFTLPPSATEMVKHRHWRITVGQLDLADTALLVMSIDELEGLQDREWMDRFTPGLVQLRDRLETALFALIGKGWRTILLP